MADSYRLEAALRMADEITEGLRKQIIDVAGKMAKDAEHPLLARYLSGRTGDLHLWACHLHAWSSVAEALRRDSGSGPKGENSRSEVECEAPQSGGEAVSP